MMMHECFRTDVEWNGVITVGYRIVYGPDSITQRKPSGTARIRILVVLSFLFFALMVRFIWPEGREVLAIHLLPQNQTVTEMALSNLLEDLRHGEQIMDSLTVFCREILYEIH